MQVCLQVSQIGVQVMCELRLRLNRCRVGVVVGSAVFEVHPSLLVLLSVLVDSPNLCLDVV